MKIFITKYALQGLIIAAKAVPNGKFGQLMVESSLKPLNVKQGEWFHTKTEAQRDANARIQRQIAVLESKAEGLRRLKFTLRKL